MAENNQNDTAPKHMALVFIAVTASTAAVTYNSMAIITAIPAMKADFDMSLTVTQWVMNGYTLACAVLIAAMGRFGDIFGHIRVIIFGMACFLLGALTCLFSPDTMVVLSGRILQGVAAAAILSTSLAILNNAVPKEKRAAAIGIWGAMVALGLGLGSVIGGILTYYSWRAVFAFDVVLVLPALISALRIIRSARQPVERDKAAIDYPGLVLFVLFLGPLAFGLTQGQAAGWGAAQTIIPLAVAVASGVLFVVVELRVDDPLIRFDFFRRRDYTAGTIGMYIVGANNTTFLYYFILFAQSPDGLSYSPINAGLSLVPFSAAMFLFAVGMPRLRGVTASPALIGAAMAALALGYWLVHDITSHSAYGDIWWRMVFIGIGSGLIFALLPGAALRALPDEDAGQGSGVLNTSLYFGLTMGVVGGGIVTAISLRQSLTSVVKQLRLPPREETQLTQILVHGTPSEIEATFERFAGRGPADFKQATQAAIESSFGDAMLLGAAVAVIGLVLMVWLLRGGPTGETKGAAA